jgi:hypothetical protein
MCEALGSPSFLAFVRLVEEKYILTTKGPSYRMRQSRKEECLWNLSGEKLDERECLMVQCGQPRGGSKTKR